MRKYLHIGFALLLLLAALPAFAVHADDDTLMLGLSVPTTTNAYYEGMVNGALAVADEMGYELVVVEADNDPATELANVQALLEQGVDAILLSPTDFDASADAILAANEAGVPLFLVGSDVTPDVEIDVVSLITSDEMVGGALAGATVCDALEGAGAVLELAADPDNARLAMRAAGLMNYMAAECPKVEATTLAYDATLDRDALVAATADALRAGSFDAVVAYDAETILAALQAGLEARVRGLTFIAFDATEDAIIAINQGSLQAVIAPNGLLMGGASVQAAAAYLDGEAIKNLIVVDQIAVTIETAATFRDPGRGGSYRFGGGEGESTSDGDEFEITLSDGGRGGSYRSSDGEGEFDDGGRGGSYRGDETGGSTD